MMSKSAIRLEQSEIGKTTEVEERELLARQRRRNIALGLILGFLALLLLVVSYVLMVTNNYAPFADQDVFGGL